MHPPACSKSVSERLAKWVLIMQLDPLDMRTLSVGQQITGSVVKERTPQGDGAQGGKSTHPAEVSHGD